MIKDMRRVIRPIACCLFLMAVSAEARAAAERPESLYQYAWYLQAGLRDLPRAIRAYQQIVKRFPDVPEVAGKAQLNIVDCYELLGKEAEARKALINAYELFPDELKKRPARMEWLARIRQRFDQSLGSELELSDKDLAREVLEMIPLREASKICETYFQSALQERAEKPQEAILSLRKTVIIGVYLGLTARAAYAQTLVGDIYAELGKYPEALGAYRRVLRDFGEEESLAAWTQLRIAETCRLTGQVDRAATAYQGVLKSYPKQRRQQAWALIWLGDLYRDQGETRRAEAAWNEVAENFAAPETAMAASVAAFLLGRQTTAPKMPGKDAFANDVAYFLAVKFELLGKYTEAKQYYQQCMDLSVQKDWPYELARRVLTPG